MDTRKQINHMIKWVGIERILEGMVRYINELIVFNSKEKYLINLREDLNKVLKNYKNRYENVN